MNKIFKLLPKSKFLQTSLIYSLVIGVNTGLRVSFVFLLGTFFNFDDLSKFFLYGALTITSDTLSIFGSYLSSNFLGKRLSCVLGFFLIIIGNILLLLSFLFKNQILLYSTLVYISLGIGILKCNLFVISNSHLQTEFSENKNDYGSILHTWSVFFSFLMIFLAGFLIKDFALFIPIVAMSCLSLTFIFFLFTQRLYILLAIKKLNFSKKKNLQLISLIIALSALLFIFFFFSSNFVIRNIPIFVFCSFLFYLLRRASKNKEEKNYIFLGIIFSFLLISYLGMERQRDTTLALFLERNIDLDFFKFLNFAPGKFLLKPIQLNSLFPIFILIVGSILFKFKIHSSLKTKNSFLLVNCGILISFGILFLQTKFSLFFSPNEFLLNPTFYIFSMIFLSFSNVLVYSKFIEICRIMPPALNQIISSFMIVSVATGFYLARFYNQFMTIENKKLNLNLVNSGSVQTLEIYSNGFLKLVFISFGFLLFWIFFLQLRFVKNILAKED